MPLRFAPRFWTAAAVPPDPDAAAPFGVAVSPTPVAAPRLLAWNVPLAERLGLTAAERADPAIVAAFAGNDVERALPGAKPTALVYAGHQFGNFVPRLGDGRAILLGEVDASGDQHFDLQLKGAGRTPYSRGGDGRAGLGPVLREFLLSEAMEALRVPTTQALVAVATGEPIYREAPLPGAVVTRVASSHLRVGTFEYFASRGDVEALRRLVRHAVDRHHDIARDSEDLTLGLLDAVVDAQARLVARWMAVGFIHGVMNTDNCSIAGETIDYGPAAFLDAYDPGRTFSSIDRQGRYAFGRQPQMAMWNLMRLGDSLVPLLLEDRVRPAGGAPRTVQDADIAACQRDVEAVVGRFHGAFTSAFRSAFARKLGVAEDAESQIDTSGDVETLLALMADAGADFTRTFRGLADVVEGVPVEDALLPALSAPSSASSSAGGPSPAALFAWVGSWRDRLVARVGAGAALVDVATRMRAENPAFIPRNHQVEAALAAAHQDDLAPFERLRRVLQRPFDDQPDAADLAAAPGAEQHGYRTFCGT